MAGSRNGTSPSAISASSLDARFRRPLMSYFLRRVGDHAEAEDLTQRVFMRMMSIGDLREIEHVEGYVFTVAANLLKDRGRVAARGARARTPVPNLDLAHEVMSELVEDRTPERVLLGRETLSEVLKSLDELGEKTRDIFILFRLENMKQREIAEFYGIGQSTVEKHVLKATLFLARKYGSD
ncbi:sigma-70 family RNA polymerase sigma factor [Phenylobacterium sp.]|uniref:RNA polymerase sigma factor n=1 Tax=Phenylobacterium sp. TaxID=1871053 RepID=UPI0025DAECB3|nr:sigma-70 family RNA polymerase sigma factor [Phenylobacterium sp.]MBX3483026.1 sigma-70 family RNA polymerase sigma factor [Phenylobacterium sp.]MCW5759138.1 sigma-70 family RNA polymerase sigma factor [Phenylobacterium sp.]